MSEKKPNPPSPTLKGTGLANDRQIEKAERPEAWPPPPPPTGKVKGGSSDDGE